MADESQSDLERLASRLRAYVTPDARHVQIDEEYVTACAEEALTLVVQIAGESLAQLPGPIVDRAVIEAGSELFHKRQAPGGISQFADATGTPMRVARDPMNVARVILAPFLPLGFA